MTTQTITLGSLISELSLSDKFEQFATTEELLLNSSLTSVTPESKSVANKFAKHSSGMSNDEIAKDFVTIMDSVTSNQANSFWYSCLQNTESKKVVMALQGFRCVSHKLREVYGLVGRGIDYKKMSDSEYEEYCDLLKKTAKKANVLQDEIDEQDKINDAYRLKFPLS